MVLQIKTTGVEQYLDGSGNIKMMVIGGPGAGKTRMSSFWPKPIYADCEGGLASVADRKVPFVEVKTSKDLLDLVAYLAQLERKHPVKAERPFHTVVIDTLDAFQRKLKDEWLLKNGTDAFRGWEAWEFIGTKMNMLMTRLLNLDYNVIVLVHYKEKTVGDGDDSKRELGLLLQGDIKDTAFGDFDLVGWLGTYWATEEGQRVEKRGLTFHRTPDKPFLKDRFHVTPRWMEITFEDSDYTSLWEAWASKVENLGDSEVLGEVPDADNEGAIKGANVVGPLPGGPVAAVEPKEVPLESMSKVDLVKLARSEEVPGITATLLKGELIQKINEFRAAKDLREEAAAKSAERQAEDAAREQRRLAEKAIAPAPQPEPQPTAPPLVDRLDEILESETQPEPATDVQPAAVDDTPAALDDSISPATEATADPSETAAAEEPLSVEQVAEALGATVVEDRPTQPQPPVAPAQREAPQRECARCGKDVGPDSNENPDLVRLSYIKFREYLCNDDYAVRKNPR